MEGNLSAYYFGAVTFFNIFAVGLKNIEIMRRCLLLLLFLAAGFCSVKMSADPIDVTLQLIKKNVYGSGSIKSPARKFVIEQEGNVLTLPAHETNFILELRDSSGELVYVEYIPSNTEIVTLPTSLSGTFEIRLDATNEYYIGILVL